jgi:ADP-ribosyl-[dinitrogen reductase] hydrolase
MKLSRPQWMNLGISEGDACGAACEFLYPNIESYRENLDFTKYQTNPKKGFSNRKAGDYTDDTQMTIMVEETLLSEFTLKNLAENVIKCFRRDPIDGYARKFQAFLEDPKINNAEEFIKNKDTNSIRNGAAMRAVPIGIVQNIDTVIEYATVNAQLTHNTPKGIASSVAVALLSHAEFYGSRYKHMTLNRYLIPKINKIDEESAKYYQDIINMDGLDTKLLLGEENQRKGVPCDGMRTVGATIYLLQNFDNASDILKNAVYLGGDTDSTASIALGIHAINHPLNTLPEFLFRDLRNDKYGRDYLLELGKRLEQKFLR